MKILLINSNRHQVPLPPFPLGLAYLAGNIDRDAHSVDVLDLMFEDDFKGRVASTVGQVAPDLIGVSIRNANIEELSFLPEIAEVVQICRKTGDARIVLGGTGFTMMPREILSHFDADLGVIGEGVVPFNLLLERLSADKPFDDIPGLVWKDRDGIRVNDSNKDENLDEFKLPDRAAFDYKKYAEALPFSANILVRRGSPFENLWDDTSRDEGKTLRLREPRRVVDELEMMKKDLGLNTVTLVASNFNYPEDYARALCEEMISRELGISWMTDMHPSFSSPSLFELMKRAGCVLVFLGVGVCSEKMLRNMGEDFTLDDIRRCCADLEKAELNYGFLVFFAGPGETKDTVEETLAFIDETNPLMVGGDIGLRIYPDTPLVEIAEKEGVISKGQDLYETTSYVAEGTKDWIYDRIAKAAQEKTGFMYGGAKPDVAGMAREAGIDLGT